MYLCGIYTLCSHFEKGMKKSKNLKQVLKIYTSICWNTPSIYILKSFFSSNFLPMYMFVSNSHNLKSSVSIISLIKCSETGKQRRHLNVSFPLPHGSQTWLKKTISYRVKCPYHCISQCCPLVTSFLCSYSTCWPSSALVIPIHHGGQGRPPD